MHAQAGPLILMGDAVHNLIDGIALALADLTPDHRAQCELRTTLLQCVGIAAGIGTIALVYLARHAGS